MSKTDPIIGAKYTFTRFKIIEIIQDILSDYNKIKLQIVNRNITGKSPKIWKIHNASVNNSWVKEKVTRKIRKISKFSKNTIYQKLYNVAKAVFKEKFIQLNVYKEKSSQINNLIFHLKKLEKDEETKLKPRTKKLIKI